MITVMPQQRMLEIRVEGLSIHTDPDRTTIREVTNAPDGGWLALIAEADRSLRTLARRLSSMTRYHADFYVGTGPDARWLGSLAEGGGPVELAGLTLGGAAGDVATPEVLSAADRDVSEATEVGFVAAPGLDGEVGWPWLAITSSGWYAYAFADARVRVSFHGGPWFRPDPRRPEGGVESAIGLDADLPVIGDTTPKTATFTYTGFRGLPIPIRATLPPMPPAYLAHHGEVALAVAGAAEHVLGRRWPLADLAAPAIRRSARSCSVCCCPAPLATFMSCRTTRRSSLSVS